MAPARCPSQTRSDGETGRSDRHGPWQRAAVVCLRSCTHRRRGHSHWWECGLAGQQRGWRTTLRSECPACICISTACGGDMEIHRCAGRPSTVSGGWASGGGVEMRCQQRGLHGRQKCFSFNMETDSGHASIGGSTRTQRRQQSQSARQCPNSHFRGWRISIDPILCRLLRCRSSALVSRLLRAIGYCTSNACPITPHCLHNASCSIVPCLA